MRVNNIKIIKKNIISKGKGEIIKYISKKDNFLKSFGEVYFSKIFKKYRKGWIFHKKIHVFLFVFMDLLSFIL